MRMLINSGIAVVVGNPESNSRTRSVGEAISAQAGAAARLPGDTPISVIELAHLGPQLFDLSSADVKAAAKTLSI